MSAGQISARQEPVAFATVLNAALLATWGLVVVLLEVSPEVAGAVTVLIGAWVAVLGWFTRRYTTPVSGEA